MSIDLTIETSKKNNIDYLELHGELDDFHAPKLTDSINKLNQPKKLIINLDNTTFIDSVGLGAIAKIGQSISGVNGKLQLICNKAQLIRLLSASGLIAALHKNIGIAETIDDAIQNLNNF